MSSVGGETICGADGKTTLRSGGALTFDAGRRSTPGADGGRQCLDAGTSRRTTAELVVGDLE